MGDLVANHNLPAGWVRWLGVHNDPKGFRQGDIVYRYYTKDGAPWTKAAPEDVSGILRTVSLDRPIVKDVDAKWNPYHDEENEKKFLARPLGRRRLTNVRPRPTG